MIYPAFSNQDDLDAPLPDISGSTDPWTRGEFAVHPAARQAVENQSPDPTLDELVAKWRDDEATDGPLNPVARAFGGYKPLPIDNRGMGHPSINGGQVTPGNSYYDESRFDPTTATGTAGSNVVWESQSNKPPSAPKKISEYLRENKPGGYFSPVEFSADVEKFAKQTLMDRGLMPGTRQYDEAFNQAISESKGRMGEFVHVPDPKSIIQVKDANGNTRLYNIVTKEWTDSPDHPAKAWTADDVRRGAPGAPRMGTPEGKAILQDEFRTKTQEASKNKTEFAQRLAEIKSNNDTTRTEIAKNKADKANAASSPEYELQAADRELASVDQLKSLVSPFTVGLGSLLHNIPATSAADFEANLDTLKANIAFGALQAMRSASKTGGALGAVSDRELKLLESTLGALSTKQSPASFNENLDKVKGSIERFKEAKSKLAAQQTRQPTSSPQGGQADMVPVISPSGKVGSIPRSNLQKALKAGYKQA